MSRWYIGTDTGSKALAHYAKGASAKDHKWKTRSLRNGHWVYVYDNGNETSQGSESDQRGSMNSQAETERNKVAEANADRARREKERLYDENTRAMVEQKTNLERLVLQYQRAGYKLAGKHSGAISSPDERIIMTNSKTGKNVQLPTPRELLRSSDRQKRLLSKTPAKTVETPKTQDTSKEININGLKVRPTTAADADLFKNKSSAALKDKVTISDHGGNTGIKTKVTTKDIENISDHGGNTGIKTEVTKKKKKRL